MKVVDVQDRFVDAHATAVFVVHDPPEMVRRTMLAGVSSPFPVVVDADRSAYRRWGLPRASFARIWLDPNVWRQYARLLRSGERLRRLGTDVRQLGGDFVVGADGRVRYARPQRRDDRPAVREVLDVIEAVTP